MCRYCYLLLQELQKDVDEHKSSLEYINKTGQDLLAVASEEKTEKLRADLQELNSRWIKVTASITERIGKLEKVISHLKQFQVKIS